MADLDLSPFWSREKQLTQCTDLWALAITETQFLCFHGGGILNSLQTITNFCFILMTSMKTGAVFKTFERKMMPHFASLYYNLFCCFLLELSPQ